VVTGGLWLTTSVRDPREVAKSPVARGRA